MNNRYVSFAVLALLSLTALPDAHAEAGTWESIGIRSGIALYRKQVPDSPVIAFKGEGTIDAPLTKVARILLDHGRAPEWEDSLVESKVVRMVTPLEYVELNHYRAPPLVTDRDFVADVQLSVDAEAKSFTMTYHSVNDPAVPPGRYVRGELISSTFILTSIDGGTRTRLNAELHADPKGALPKFLVNFVQQGWPVSAFEGVRRQAARTDIRPAPEFADVLGRIEGIVDRERGGSPR